MNTTSRSGMTLIELVIVLALMAGLAGVALTTLGSMGHRARYDETTARMNLIRRAVVAEDGEPGRFLRDMGRLPMRFSAAEGEELAELWRDAGGVGYGDFSGSVTWPDDPPPDGVPTSVTLRNGWNGPYLAAINDPAAALYFDGFGHAWQAGDAAVPHTIETVASLGADGAMGGTGWENEDRTLDLLSLLPETSLTVHVKALDTSTAPAIWRQVAIQAGAETYQVDALHVGLFRPDITHESRTVDAMIESGSPTATFSNLMPTTVRVFAYSTGPDQVSGTEPEWVALRAGANAVTLYLRGTP